jgi:hypothetical protein
MKETTTVEIRKETRELLKAVGTKGETYDEIVLRLVLNENRRDDECFPHADATDEELKEAIEWTEHELRILRGEIPDDNTSSFAAVATADGRVAMGRMNEFPPAVRMKKAVCTTLLKDYEAERKRRGLNKDANKLRWICEECPLTHKRVDDMQECLSADCDHVDAGTGYGLEPWKLTIACRYPQKQIRALDREEANKP